MLCSLVQLDTRRSTGHSEIACQVETVTQPHHANYNMMHIHMMGIAAEREREIGPPPNPKAYIGTAFPSAIFNLAQLYASGFDWPAATNSVLMRAAATSVAFSAFQSAGTDAWMIVVPFL